MADAAAWREKAVTIATACCPHLLTIEKKEGDVSVVLGGLLSLSVVDVASEELVRVSLIADRSCSAAISLALEVLRCVEVVDVNLFSCPFT